MGLSLLTDKQKEAAWRVEFDALGEQLVFQNVEQGAINDEAKRQAALRWLSERDRTARLAWLVFFAAAIVGVADQHHCFIGGNPLIPAALVSRRSSSLASSSGLGSCSFYQSRV